ncbi:hypothetical protein FS935_14450 [Metabacillus litoralis]|uniref:Uncharacterized protein n=1 Tax=Metabacillus litoralis TaxID=152268 RepID=A0A5C6W3C5_9BACI|nr:hypothetical protein [Metabacillus litoralis]TXC90253.1 hypothetical protein FS935_14450 [Metabacillus litoralis]
MSKKTTDVFKLLKQIGFKLEHTLNTSIKDKLNNEEIAMAMNSGGKVIAQISEAIQEYVEEVSSQLNLPTKKDIGRLGKLIVQSEDKLDDIEDEIKEAINLLRELKMEIDKKAIHATKYIKPACHKGKKQWKNKQVYLNKQVCKKIDKIKDSVIDITSKHSICSKTKDSHSNSNMANIKQELLDQLLQPTTNVDLKEVNNLLTKLLQEKIRNSGSENG